MMHSDKNFKIDNIVRHPLDFDLVVFRKYPVYKLKRNIDKKIFGLDTETLDGYCKLICDSEDNYLLDSDMLGILKFLTAKKFRSSHNFFFNLNFDVNAIIKFLPKDNLLELYENLKTDFEKYNLFYIPKKFFRITHNKHVYKFHDIAQFYESSLEKAVKLYLGQEKYKDSFSHIDTARLGTDKQYWKDNLPAIIKYCKSDAKLTKELGILLNKTLIKAIDLYPTTYTSKASICKEFIRKKVNVPDVLKIDKQVLKYAFYGYSGGRFEVFTKGYIGKASLFDIKSAYPNSIRNLLDVTKGKWIRTKSLHESATYGFYLVNVSAKYSRISPLTLPLKSNTICYPLMTTKLYMTKKELLAYEPYIEFEILDGWEFWPDKLIYPFREYIDTLFSYKDSTNSEHYEYKLYKIMLNSPYGCFWEKNPSDNLEKIKYCMEKGLNPIEVDMPDTVVYAGKLFNPIYASQITAETRIDIFKTAKLHEKDTIAFATDSVLFKGKPDIPLSKELGGWNLENEGETIVLRSGIYKIGNKLKNRGIKKADNLKTPHGNFIDIFDYIEKMPNLTKYPITINRPLTFAEVLLHHKKRTLNDINQFIDMEYIIDINKDIKRNWNDNFKNGGDLFQRSIDSIPLILY